jgi:histidinol-phosphate aminotransferase
MTWRELLRDGILELPEVSAGDYAAGAGTADLARLDLNEGALPPSRDEMASLARELGKLDLNRYPEATGKVLRERLAERWAVDPEEILLGNGSVEIIGILMTAFGGAQHGRAAKVMHPEPTFGQYDLMASAYGLTAVPVALGPRFELDEACVAATIERERPTLAFFASPNNPTGNLLPAAALERLARQMAAVFVVDEAYADFSGTTLIAQTRSTPGLFVMRSLSKIGLAGLRVGALIGDRAAIAELDKVRLPYNVNAVSLAFATCMLAHPARLDERIGAVIRLRESLEHELRQIEDVEVSPSKANFVLVRTPYDGLSVLQRLLTRHILVRAFPHVPRLEHCVRITAGTGSENARCVQALREILADLGRRPSPALNLALSHA